MLRKTRGKTNFQTDTNYAAAQPLYRQATDIWRDALGEDHPDFAVGLNNLAALYSAMGDYAAAEPLCRQASDILRKTLGNNHPHVAASLNTLAGLYKSVGNHYAAEPLYRQAIEIPRTVLGEHHPQFAAGVGALAGLYHSVGNYAAAEPLYRQEMEILRTILGEHHPRLASSLNNLAALYHSLGNYTAAERLYRQASDLCRNAFGEYNPETAASLINLAVLHVALARTNDAFSLMKRAMTIQDQMIGQVFSVGSESRRSAYVNKLEETFECFLSLVWQHLQDSSEAVRFALELVLRRKAIGAEALAVQRDAVLGGQYPHLKPTLRRLTALRMQVAQKTLAGPGPEGLPEHNRLLAEWNAEKEQLESNLARQIPEMNLQRKLHAADRRAVALSLDEGTALIEFIRFHEFDFRAVAERINETEWLPLQTRKPARYLAFILLASQPDNVRMVDLGEAEPIDRMIADFRAGFTGEAERFRGMVAVSQYQQPLAAANGGLRLRKAVFDKVVEAVDGRTRLFLALDGDLTRLPFETLPTDDGRCLIDSYQISYLSVGRDILRFAAPTTGEPADPVVIADPDFDLAASGVAHVSDAGDAGCQSVATSGYVANLYDRRFSREFESGQHHFQRLPGTRREGWEIATMLRVEPRLADMALEAALKQCRSPQILHVATHGFFFPNQSYDPERESRGLRAPAQPARLARQGLKNPLLRSGLALSGANTWLAGGSLPPEAEDGLLTAEDVSGLNLLATDLVVLSACETGLGDIRTGEGVFGLRRAFVLAGAKSLVMSLWRVPDEQTRELMVDFYRRLQAGEPRAEALRQAQLAVKQKNPNPWYWGAFICQGDPSPISKR